MLGPWCFRDWSMVAPLCSRGIHVVRLGPRCLDGELMVLHGACVVGLYRLHGAPVVGS